MAISSSPIALVVGDARGRLLDEVVRSDRPRSIRDWARRADVSHGHARSLLTEFEHLGLIRSDRVGSSIVYQGIPDSALRKRLQGLLEVPADIIESARQIAAGAPRGTTVTVFGSVANETATADSDVDICIVAPSEPANEDWVNRFADTMRDVSGSPVNILRYTPENWDESLSGNETVTTDIARTGIIVTPTDV